MKSLSFCADAAILLTKPARTTVSGASAAALPKKDVSVNVQSDRMLFLTQNSPLKSCAHGLVEEPPGVDH